MKNRTTDETSSPSSLSLTPCLTPSSAPSRQTATGSPCNRTTPATRRACRAACSAWSRRAVERRRTRVVPDQLAVAGGRLGRMALKIAEAVVDLVADQCRGRPGPRALGDVPRIGKPFCVTWAMYSAPSAVGPPVTVISPAFRRLSNVRSERSSNSSFGKRGVPPHLLRHLGVDRLGRESVALR